MKHRWTIKELQRFNDLEIIRATLSDRMSDLTNVYSPFYKKLKKLYSKIDNLILSGESKLDHEGFFKITSIHRDDIAGQFDQVTAKNFDDADMKDIASHMADAYCETAFWSDLKDIVREHLTDDEGNPMELISEGEYVMIYKLHNGNLLLRATNEAKEEYGDNGEELLEKDIDEAFFDFLLQDHLTYEFEVLEPEQALKDKNYFVITNEVIDETSIIAEDQEIEDAPCYINYWWYCKKENSIQSIFENGLIMQFEQYNQRGDKSEKE